MGLLDKVAFLYFRDLELPHNPKGYLVLCMSSVEDVEDEFELEIHSSKELQIEKSTSLIEEFKFEKELDLNWSLSNSGGSVSERTFTRNMFLDVFAL